MNGCDHNEKVKVRSKGQAFSSACKKILSEIIVGSFLHVGYAHLLTNTDSGQLMLVKVVELYTLAKKVGRLLNINAKNYIFIS
jgi:hypothetical protein